MIYFITDFTFIAIMKFFLLFQHDTKTTQPTDEIPHPYWHIKQIIQ